MKDFKREDDLNSNMSNKTGEALKDAARAVYKQFTDLGAAFLPAARGADLSLPSHQGVIKHSDLDIIEGNRSKKPEDTSGLAGKSKRTSPFDLL